MRYLMFLFLFSFLNLSFAQTEFVCDGQPIIVRNDPSDVAIYDIDTNTFSSTNFLDDIVANGIGYNILDNFIYGLVRSANSLPGFTNSDVLRIGSDGVVVNLGMPLPALPPGNWTTVERNIGTMDASGNWYGFNANRTVMYVLDIGTATAPGTFTFQQIPLTGDSTVGFFDITFNPLDGNLYGVDSGTLNQITPAGVVSSFVDADLDTTNGTLPSNAGGAWSNGSGVLFFYRNKASGDCPRLWSI